MESSKAALLVRFAGVCLGLFIAIDVVAGLLDSDQLAKAAALSATQEKGWKTDDLSIRQVEVSSWVLGKWAHVELKPKDPGMHKTIQVSLRKPINLLAWKVVGYDEEPNDTVIGTPK